MCVCLSQIMKVKGEMEKKNAMKKLHTQNDVQNESNDFRFQ